MAVITSSKMAAAVCLVLLLASMINCASLNRSRNSLMEDEDKGETMTDVGEGNAGGDIGNRNYYRKALVMLKRVLARAATAPDSSDLMTPFRKRTCYFNGGMSHSCDYKELLKSVDDANYWSSDFTPGRRRKRHYSSRESTATRSIAPTIPPQSF